MAAWLPSGGAGTANPPVKGEVVPDCTKTSPELPGWTNLVQPANAPVSNPQLVVPVQGLLPPPPVTTPLVGQFGSHPVVGITGLVMITGVGSTIWPPVKTFPRLVACCCCCCLSCSGGGSFLGDTL